MDIMYAYFLHKDKIQAIERKNKLKEAQKKRERMEKLLKPRKIERRFSI